MPVMTGSRPGSDGSVRGQLAVNFQDNGEGQQLQKFMQIDADECG